MPNTTSDDAKPGKSAPAGPRLIKPLWLRLVLSALAWLFGLAAAGVIAVVVVVAVALAVAYPNLPDISDLQDYRPKLPLRVYSADGALLGEFGEERRNLMPIAEIPQVMKDAVLAIEDSRFYQHGGVDYIGVARAAMANLGRLKSQGASTITMQVARNVYLSAEKTLTRKIYEILLTFKLEHELSKDQILEIYMNQIFLGNRAYGFAAASEAYFGKPLKSVTIAEAAMLAGLPKAPSAYNPIVNPSRAKARQLYIIERMVENNFITAGQGQEAKLQELRYSSGTSAKRVHGEYIAEMARQLIFSQYGDDTYTRGLNVVTTIRSEDQEVAYKTLRKGLMDYDRRQAYRGPEKFVDLPKDAKAREEMIDEALLEHPDNGDLLSAVVLEVSPRRILATRHSGEQIEITGDGLRAAASGLSDKAAPNIKIRRGAVIRVVKNARNTWDIAQVPEVEGAFVALDPRDGAIRALVGGFDFDKNKFNHVVQAWRQPGSSFKPFVYSAGLEKGFTPATVINDAPLFFSGAVTGGQPWEPKNYDGNFDGAMSMRRALARSKNMVSIRVLQTVGTQAAQEWVTRFGFDSDKNPPYLTLALGAGAATPMQMAEGYAAFANGGYRVSPALITRIFDQRGKVLVDTAPAAPTEANRVIDRRNAFVMHSLMQEVTKTGTAASAQKLLKRADIAGKTGTTNDSHDAWFVGYHPTVVAAVWIGYDNPRKLGDKETGGGLSLPVWIGYMQHALKGVKAFEYPAPEGVVNINGEWYYEEYARGGGISSVGLEDPLPGVGTVPTDPNAAPTDPNAPGGNGKERDQILDIFRN
jgi:penicillin-binding protein 1A